MAGYILLSPMENSMPCFYSNIIMLHWHTIVKSGIIKNLSSALLVLLIWETLA